MMFEGKRKSFKKAMSVLMVLIIFNGLGFSQVFATSELIFHSGFEPNSTAVQVTADPGALYKIQGTDNTFTDNNNWVNDLDNHPNIGSGRMNYQPYDNSHQRYANIIDDPTGMLFEDSFDDAYAIGDTPHMVANDMGKRNWTLYTTSYTTMTVAADPVNATNQVMKVQSTKTTVNYPKLDKNLDVSSTKIMNIDYKVMNLSHHAYINIDLPSVSGAPSKVGAVSLSGSTATAGSSTATIDPNAWTSVSIRCDLYNNFYDVYINGAQLAQRIPLFTTPQTDFSNVKIRFCSELNQNEYTYFDDVKIKLTPVRFEDDFELNYSVGDAPHIVTGDKGRINWSSYYNSYADISAQNDPLNSNNKALKILSTKSTINYPKVEKNLDMSSTQRMAINYKVMNLDRKAYINIDLPSVSGAPSKTGVVTLNGSTATAGSSSVTINPNAWTSVSIQCDLYDNQYAVYINGVLLAQRLTLFSAPQTDFRNIRVRFCAELNQNEYTYFDDVQITNAANKVLKFYAGEVINDEKLRVQYAINENNGLTSVYYKYRMYLGDGFETLKTAGQNISGFWLTLGEFFDGSNWAVPLPTPNYCSRISFGIDQPTDSSSPLRFGVDYQTADDQAKYELPYVWEYFSTVSVPINQWATMEVYLKQGVGSDPNNGGGIFQVFMTLDDGVRQTVFDINNTTYDNGFPLDGFEHIQPLKLYGTKNIFNNINAANSDVQIYFDDFELRKDKP